MRGTRLYIPGTLREGDSRLVEGPAAHHVRNVLRLRSGAAVQVFNGDGSEHVATLRETGRTSITLDIAGAVTPLAEPSLRVTLAQGIARNDRMDLILQKAVELGVSAIRPLWMQRSQKHLTGERLQKRLQHWRGVIIGACEQSGRATLPELHAPVPLGTWLSGQQDRTTRLMLQPESPRALGDLPPPGATGITLVVGPEGGLSPEERELAARGECTGIRLGQRILRTETAGLAALAGIQVLWGDFR